jgi:uncharacterized protein YutE (UPF0331/DUF86 family)
MIDQDIVFAKIANIHSCLKRIQAVTHMDPDSLDDLDTQDIFVLNLQRAAQSAIDLAAHLIAAEGLGLPSSLREYFTILERSKILPAGLARKMEAMVGFRNIAVHAYQDLDVMILKAILMDHLTDLDAYTRTVLDHSNLGEG